MKNKYIYKGEEILHSTFISLCRKIGVKWWEKIYYFGEIAARSKQRKRKSD